MIRSVGITLIVCTVLGVQSFALQRDDQWAKDRKLMQTAIREGNMGRVKRLLEIGYIDADEESYDPTSSMRTWPGFVIDNYFLSSQHQGDLNNTEAMIDLFLQKGANLNRADGYALMRLVVSNGSLDNRPALLRYLLSKGADPNLPQPSVLAINVLRAHTFCDPPECVVGYPCEETNSLSKIYFEMLQDLLKAGANANVRLGRGAEQFTELTYLVFGAIRGQFHSGAFTKDWHVQYIRAVASYLKPNGVNEKDGLNRRAIDYTSLVMDKQDPHKCIPIPPGSPTAVLAQKIRDVLLHKGSAPPDPANQGCGI